MTDSNRTALALIREATLGVTPANPVIRAQRITGAPNLGFIPGTITSNELREDRQVSDLILVGAEAGGDEAFELSYGAQDDLFEASLFSAWVRQPFREGANVGAVTTDSLAVTDTSGAGGGTFAPGDLVRLEGFAVAANNGVFVCAAGTDADTLNIVGLVAEANPPDATAKVVRVGRVGASADIVATVSGGNALTSTVLDFTTLGLVVGDWIKIGDGNVAARSFATAADNIFARVTAIAAARLDLFAPSTFANDTGTGKTIALLFGDRVRNGVTRSSFSIEERFTAHSPETVQLFAGMVPGMLNLQLSPQAIMTGAVTFMGLSASVANPTAPGDYSNIYAGTVVRVTAPDNSVLNTSRNVGRLGRGANPIEGPNYVLEATIAVNNNLRRKNAVGQFGSIDIGVGEFNVTGTLNTYFGDKAILEQVLTNAETSVDFAVRDSTGRAIVIDLPRIKFSSGAPDVTGKNQDVAANMGFQAIRHATLGYTMQVQRFGYAA